MKELRCIVFTERELVSAVIDRHRRRGEAMPQGAIASVRFTVEGNVTTYFTIVDELGVPSEFELPEAEVAAALISFCMAKGVPLPAGADKVLYVIKGAPTLMITMNFNKAPRLIAEDTERVQSDRSRTRRPMLRAVG